MAQEDFEDLNVMSLTETKSQRAPTPEPLRAKWLAPAVATVFIGLIAFAIIHRRQ